MEKNNEEYFDEEDVISEELEVNKKNREESESLMSKAGTNLDGYWDKDNLFVKLLLFGLALFIIIGCVIIFI